MVQQLSTMLQLNHIDPLKSGSILTNGTERALVGKKGQGIWHQDRNDRND